MVPENRQKGQKVGPPEIGAENIILSKNILSQIGAENDCSHQNNYCKHVKHASKIT